MPMRVAGPEHQARPAEAGTAFVPVELRPWFDNDAISTAANPGDGGFNVWGNSFAAEYLPESGARVTVDGVPFDFPDKADGQMNNVRCAGQLVGVPAGRYDWLYLLAASERRSEDTVAMHFAGGAVDFEPLRVSDFWAAPACFGESPAFVAEVMHYPHHVQQGVPATMWCQRVAVGRRAELTRVRFPRNLAIHVFAATLVRSILPT
jgi:hypothetical protein